MALRDYEAFIRQCASKFDPDMDVSVGSSFDTQVVQPILRRLGTDPFSVDLATFITDRLVQAFPTMATKEGDALTDLLTKPATLLWDPLVREIKRVQQQLSLKDPTVLTLDEADSLGGNFFRPRTKGEYAKGISRTLFAQPQNVTVSPVNFFTAKGGLRFSPTRTQSIKTEEMLLNVYESYYYFDVNVVAEKPGTKYSIGPNEMQSVANLPACVRVINLNRFGYGEDEEDAVQYIDRIGQELGEKSMVALRGIAAKLKDAFPEMNRLNVVGFGDPEMERDVLVGGGLGELKAYGVSGQATPDGEGLQYTRRFYSNEVDFTTTLSGDATSWVLTVFGATGSVVLAKDFQVASVVSSTELDLVEQGLQYGAAGLNWTLRKKEVTLSSIPGGILFPDSPNGTVAVPDDRVHVGGCYDIHTRGSGFDTASVLIDSVTDDDPLVSGTGLVISVSDVALNDYVLGVDYEVGDELYQIFDSADIFNYSLQILDGVDAGTYRVLSVTQVGAQPVKLVLDPTPTNPGATSYRWRLFDEINIDLVDPKETRISGVDLRTTQGSTDVTTVGGIDFDEYGVAEGDVLRILNGSDAGDYGITEDPLAPSYDWVRLDRELTRSQTNLQYIIFRPNKAGGISLPLVRVTSIDLLDSSKQPLGSTIPYAKPVDAQSRAFQNPRRGIKHDLSDVRLGLVSMEATAGVFAITAGQVLSITVHGDVDVTTTAIFAAGPFTISAVLAYINSAMSGIGYPNAAVQVGNRIGIRPVVPGGVEVTGGSAMAALFTQNSEVDTRSTADIICDDVTDWSALDPVIDFSTGLDVVQVMDGVGVGYYEGPFVHIPSAAYILQQGTASPHQFAPEEGRRVQIGSRSIGSARLYFLEPTSIEVDGNTRFQVEYDNHTLNYLPDPTLDHQRIPSLPNGTYPSDGDSTDAATTFTSSSTDFLRSGIREGDKLVLLTHPIAGDLVLSTDPVPGVALKTFVFSLDGGPDRTLTFIRDDTSLSIPLGEVTRQGVVDQINAAFGKEIADLTALNTIRFDTELPLVIRKSGTVNSVILGNVDGTSPVVSFSAQDVNNESPHSTPSTGNEYYEILAVTEHTLTVSPAFPSSAPFSSPIIDQYFKVMRSGVQRICTTQMSEQVAEAGLYYFDVELVSEGTGDVWNIPADVQMTPSGYRADGYWLTTLDENVSFSTVEKPQLVLSRTILENGVDDNPLNSTQLSGQNIQVNYERAELVSNIQGFASSETERVVCANPLSRHLIPHFVRYDFTYTGGSKESVVIPDMEKYIKGLFPMDALESSDLQKLALDRGATSIQNPIDIIAVVHYPDRSIYVVRSQDSITTGRLAAFIPDRLNVVRRTA
jgi:hypothetical protein